MKNYAFLIRDLQIRAELRQCLWVLASADIPTIVLKGAALKQAVYGPTDRRPISDVDLLIKPEDLYDACLAFKQASYLPVYEQLSFFSPFNSNIVGELTFRGQFGISIDLHWELVSVEWLRKLIPIDLSYVWQTACHLPAPYDEGYQLEPAVLLIHLCVHLVQHSFAHTVGFKDIVMVLQHYQDFPWAKFLELSSLWGANTVCFMILETVASQHAQLVPVSILVFLRPPHWKRRLIVSVADPKEGVAGRLGRNAKERRYILHMLMADSLGRFVIFLIWILFPGLTWCAEHYRLTSRTSSCLAMVWHPFFVLFQGLLSVLALLPRFSTQEDSE